MEQVINCQSNNIATMVEEIFEKWKYKFNTSWDGSRRKQSKIVSCILHLTIYILYYLAYVSQIMLRNSFFQLFFVLHIYKTKRNPDKEKCFRKIHLRSSSKYSVKSCVFNRNYLLSGKFHKTLILKMKNVQIEFSYFIFWHFMFVTRTTQLCSSIIFIYLRTYFYVI